MFQIGASLAAAREARGLGLRDAELLTCMRSRYLEALEQERWDVLPGRTYARAFLRTYANALELDADAFVAEFDEQFPPPPEPEELAPPRRRRPTIPVAVAPAAAVVALLVVLAWSAWSGGGGNPSAHTNLPPPPATVASAPVQPTIPHVRAATKTVTHPVLVVRAVTGRCWVQARAGGPAGAVLAEQTLEQGETLRLARQHVWLRLGAPWTVKVTRGSKTVAVPVSTGPENLTA